jgi:hypothetical protein
LLRHNVIGGIPAWRQNQICVTQRAPAQSPQWLPDLNPVRADNSLHPWRRNPHRLDYGSQIRVRGQDQFCLAARCPQCRHRESPLRASAPREHEFARSQRHAVQLRRILQAEKAAIHAAAGSKFREHGSKVTAGTLHPTGRVQFWEEANDHGQSLPSAGHNGKSGCMVISETPRSIAAVLVAGIADLLAV